jgi:Cu(I)/Ag(I) efflux system periplasmic protein CusF
MACRPHLQSFGFVIRRRCASPRSPVMKHIAVLISTLALALTAAAQPAPSTGDKEAGKVTLKHGEIKNLDMPPMTMVFRVAEPKMLDSLAVGSRISFTAEKLNGQYTLTSVRRVP